MAIEFFQDRNIKTIKKMDISAFIDSLDCADKTKANYASQLHDMFYNYLYGEVEVLNLANLPKFPEVEYELRIQERERIIDELKKADGEEK